MPYDYYLNAVMLINAKKKIYIIFSIFILVGEFLKIFHIHTTINTTYKSATSGCLNCTSV